ncbi:zinc ABC transporter permease [Suicoccus acidiformans]|uniref:Zinc ABC transporter permease n=1 Tax=Suicoccus acidiformans TaxID=2036206 RepID=A0A347WJ74_9LACT|nr:metal ABC transporter permease [Suicoccus acidiformans]AXY25131.1 zinc ABC transporter permease [Suicoccus acidiformans]
MDTVIRVLQDHTFQTVALGTGALGLLSGVLGVFLTLRRQSLLGDALGHAALPGIVLVFIFILERNMGFLLLGATISGLIATWLINWMSDHESVVKQDSALAIVLSTFFGLGTALLTYVQKIPTAAQAGLDKFIFGQASGMLRSDVQTIVITGIIIIALIVVFWKEFKLITFDQAFAQTLPGKYHRFAYLLSLLTVITIVLGLEAVGVVLISALLVNPAIAARQWSNQMSVVVVLSGIFGLISGVVGAFISSLGTEIPTGATIVVVATIITVISLFFAPRRGVIATQINRSRKQQALKEQMRREVAD